VDPESLTCISSRRLMDGSSKPALLMIILMNVEKGQGIREMDNG